MVFLVFAPFVIVIAMDRQLWGDGPRSLPGDILYGFAVFAAFAMAWLAQWLASWWSADVTGKHPPAK